MDLNFDLHPNQFEVFSNPARFKVVKAGRRWGKTRLQILTLFIEALKNEKNGYSLHNKEVFYVAPTFQQAKDIIWGEMKHLGQGIIEHTVENTGTATLVNGRKIQLKGSDRPDTLRGVGLSHVGIDEYADMKPDVWEQILRPTLADVKGSGLFTGTPKGKNHFYQLILDAEKDPNWATFSFSSTDNPYLDPTEIEAARQNMSLDNFRQEFEASFQSGGGQIFTEDMIQIGDEPVDGHWYIAVDLSGFTEAKGTESKLKKYDEHAISIVKVNKDGWYVKDVLTGRWGVRETAVQIMMAAREVRPSAVGIEQGALKNAVMPYLSEQMSRLGLYMNIVALTHGQKRKQDRIAWALQGRMQHGRVKFREAPYLKKLTDQFLDFPNSLAHDDMVDSLSYIDQLATVSFQDEFQIDTWEPLDNASGY
jgi:predicted phage terminase large subunit-like protein